MRDLDFCRDFYCIIYLHRSYAQMRRREHQALQCGYQAGNKTGFRRGSNETRPVAWAVWQPIMLAGIMAFKDRAKDAVAVNWSLEVARGTDRTRAA